MKSLAFLAVFLVAGGAAIPAHSPTVARVEHAATFYVGFEDGTCSGAAISPTHFITAAHCFEGGKLVKVGGLLVEQVGAPIFDGNDHAIVKVRPASCKDRGVRCDPRAFRRWAQLGARKLKQGEELRWWGNPRGLTDLYRKGYVMGYEQGWTLVDAIVQQGDSGSAIFDKHGRIVSIVSTLFVMGEGFHGMGCKPLAFTREQLASAGL